MPESNYMVAKSRKRLQVRWHCMVCKETADDLSKPFSLFGLTRYETAFGILHKLRAGMVRPDQDRIGGRPKEHVEVDETWVGGRTRGEGRGIHHKTLVAAAVEVRHRKPGTAQDKRRFCRKLCFAVAWGIIAGQGFSGTAR